MTEVQVVYLSPAIEKWSSGILQHLFDGRLWRCPGISYRQVSQRSAAKGEPAVIVIPGEEWADRKKVAELNRYLARFPHVVLCVIADEGSTFPWQDVLHDSLRWWIQTPRPGVHPPASDERFYFGFGWHPDTPDVLRAADRAKRDDWFFAGQITHDSRRELADVLRGMDGGTLIETEGFGQGIDRHEYLAKMAAARVVPCPSGPLTPDSFRLYEALEAGAVPIVEPTCPAYMEDYWSLVYNPIVPDRVDRWEDFPAEMECASADGYLCSMWWQAFKWQMAWRMRDDVLGPEAPVDGITVIITASHIPSHPSLEVLTETVESVRKQPGLEDAEIIVACDGMALGSLDAVDYRESLRRLADLTEHEWPQVLPIHSSLPVHQANMLRLALRVTRTPLVLFMEHDTPLCGDTPWGELGDVILSGQANVIRLSSEASILEPWRHLFLDTQDAPQYVGGLPLVRTVQWSSRPHLADADWYRRIIDTWFDPSSRIFTEEVLHGVVQHAWRTRREAGWREWRLWMYAPPGDMKRSWHTDGRAGADKGEDGWVFAYPGGGTPPGAPRATADRVPE